MALTDWSDDILIVDLNDEPAFSDDMDALCRRLDMPVKKPPSPDVILNLQAVTYGLPNAYDPFTLGPEEERFRLAAGFQWYMPTNASPVPEVLKINGDIKNPAIGNVYTNQQTARPSSYHAGGVNMGFLDGHVQFIPDTVDYAVYIQLMTPNSVASDAPNITVPGQPATVTYKNIQIPWDQIN